MTNTNTTPATTPATPAKRAPAKGKAKPSTPAKRRAPAKGKAKVKALPKGYGLRAAPTAEGKRRSAYAETDVVVLVSTENPKRPGTGAFARYQQYLLLAKKGEFTVADVLNKGVQPSDLRYNVKHGHVKLAKAKAKK